VIIQPSRRSFLSGLASLVVAAPAIVRAESLMPVKALADWPLTLNGIELVCDKTEGPIYWDVDGLLAARFEAAKQVMINGIVHNLYEAPQQAVNAQPGLLTWLEIPK
jgi:hypothetical protein